MSSRKQRSELFAEFMTGVVDRSLSDISKKKLRAEFEEKHPSLGCYYDGLFSQYKSKNRGKVFTGSTKVYFSHGSESASKFQHRLNRNQNRAQKKLVAESREKYKKTRDNFFINGFRKTGEVPTWSDWASENMPKVERNPKAHHDPPIR